MHASVSCLDASCVLVPLGMMLHHAQDALGHAPVGNIHVVLRFETLIHASHTMLVSPRTSHPDVPPVRSPPSIWGERIVVVVVLRTQH